MKQPTQPRPAARTCTSCKRTVDAHQIRRTWCAACYMRWRKAGRPDTGPPPSPGHPGLSPKARAASVASAQRQAAERLRRYQELAATGMPPKRIARLLGVHVCTVYTYARQVKG